MLLSWLSGSDLNSVDVSVAKKVYKNFHKQCHKIIRQSANYWVLMAGAHHCAFFSEKTLLTFRFSSFSTLLVYNVHQENMPQGPLLPSLNNKLVTFITCNMHGV